MKKSESQRVSFTFLSFIFDDRKRNDHIYIYIYIYDKLDSINNYIVEMAILQMRSQNRPEMSKNKVGENKIEVGEK